MRSTGKSSIPQGPQSRQWRRPIAAAAALATIATQSPSISTAFSATPPGGVSAVVSQKSSSVFQPPLRSRGLATAARGRESDASVALAASGKAKVTEVATFAMG